MQAKLNAYRDTAVSPGPSEQLHLGLSPRAVGLYVREGADEARWRPNSGRNRPENGDVHEGAGRPVHYGAVKHHPGGKGLTPAKQFYLLAA